MNYKAYQEKHNLVKINITKARRLYNSGITIIANPCKMRMNTMWNNGFQLSPDREIPFGELVNNIVYYNCTSETGKYLHFYYIESSELVEIL